MRYSTVAMALCAVALGATGVVGQGCPSGTVGTCTATSHISFSVPQVLHIDVSGDFVFPAEASETNFTDKYISSTSGVDVNYGGNTPFHVEAFAAAFTGTGNNNKPTSDVSLTDAATSTETSMLDASASKTIITAASAGSGNTTYDAKVKLDYGTDTQGSYNTTVTFTIVAP